MAPVQERVARIGRRKIAYEDFVSLLVPFGMLMEAAGPPGPDPGGGIMAAIVLWSVVSLIFFIGIRLGKRDNVLGRQRALGGGIDCD